MYCTQCGHRNPRDSRFCAKCGHPLQEDSTATFTPVEIEDETGEVEHPPARRARGGAGAARRQARSGRRVAVPARQGRRGVRPPSRERRVPGRHHRLAQAPGAATQGRRVLGARHGQPERHVRERRAGRGDASSRTATRSRSASSSSSSSRPRSDVDGHAKLSVDRRGPRGPQGRVPRHHHQQDPLPGGGGADRSRAHAVRVPKVLRQGRRPAAPDPAPAARRVPAAEGHQGAPGHAPVLLVLAIRLPRGHRGPGHRRVGRGRPRRGPASRGPRRRASSRRSRTTSSRRRRACRCRSRSCPRPPASRRT